MRSGCKPPPNNRPTTTAKRNNIKNYKQKEKRTFAPEHVTRQVETSLLILAPVISLFLIFQNLIIHILYTPAFLAISGYISWAVLGMLFRAFSWSVSFVLLAKGAGRIFLITEIVADSLMFVMYLVGSHVPTTILYPRRQPINGDNIP